MLIQYADRWSILLSKAFCNLKLKLEQVEQKKIHQLHDIKMVHPPTTSSRFLFHSPHVEERIPYTGRYLKHLTTNC